MVVVVIAWYDVLLRCHFEIIIGDWVDIVVIVVVAVVIAIFAVAALVV